MFVPDVAAVGGLLWLSAIVALLPVAVFFVLVGAVRMRSHWAGAIALGVGLLVAIAGFQMPVDMAVAAAAMGEPERETDLFHEVLGWSLALLLFVVFVGFILGLSLW